MVRKKRLYVVRHSRGQGHIRSVSKSAAMVQAKKRGYKKARITGTT